MITHNHLYEKIIHFDNLLVAAKKATKGKRYKHYPAVFNFYLEKEILILKEELDKKLYNPGKYESFNIYEPKKRLISAAPFRDRVVHHALYNIIEPIFEKTFIYDSYANRKSKGTHRAIRRYQEFARKNKYVLKCDIKKYFPSIDHQILKETIRKKIRCEDTMGLIDRIIDNSNLQEDVAVYFEGDDLFTPFERRRGIPIGNLTSQFFANIYLNPLDHYVKEYLKCKHYIRYVDDFVLFSNDKRELNHHLLMLHRFLERFRLRLHKNKTKVFPVKDGVGFLGHRVYPYYSKLKKENLRRFYKRLRNQKRKLEEGTLEPEKFLQSMQSWMAHASFSNTYSLRLNVLQNIQDIGLDEYSYFAGRFVEQQR